MISYTCDNCGLTVAAENSMLPSGWYTLTLNVMAPPTPPPENGGTMPVSAPAMAQAHAHNQECYDALIGTSVFGKKKK